MIHDVNGSLAAITLHLRMAAQDDLPARAAAHVRDSLEALRHVRDQLVELNEIVAELGLPAKPARSS